MLGVLVAVFQSSTDWSQWVANRNICSCLRRGQIHINFFYVHLLPQRIMDSCHIFASLKYSAFVPPIMVRWCSVLGAEQCWVVLWTTH